MKLLAKAKINLCLDVLGKDRSGYHKIQTVFQEVDNLADEIEILNGIKKDEVAMAGPVLQENNLAYKALVLLKTTFQIKKFTKIKIKKNIPISSGLGGGASDAAAVLKGLNKLWNLKLSTQKLIELSKNLGMDVAFFIVGGTALGEHFGEKITPLPPLKKIKFRLFLNGVEIPKKADIFVLDAFPKTKQAYATIKLSKCGKNKAKTKKLIEAIKKGNKTQIIENLHNDFETQTKISTLHHLSGSGPSTFIIQ